MEATYTRDYRILWRQVVWFLASEALGCSDCLWVRGRRSRTGLCGGLCVTFSATLLSRFALSLLEKEHELLQSSRIQDYMSHSHSVQLNAS